MSHRFLQTTVFIVLCLSAACESADDSGDDVHSGGSSSHAGGAMNTGGAMNAGGAGGAGVPPEAILAACAKMCETTVALDQATPCEPGDSFVRGALVPMGEGGAGGTGAVPQAGAGPTAECVQHCVENFGQTTPQCTPQLAALGVCWAQVEFVCDVSGFGWLPQGCDSESQDIAACVSP